MSCAQVRELLGALVVGALDRDEHEVVRRHLAVCPGCRREYDELAVLPEYLGELTVEEVQRGPVHADSAMLDRLLARVAAERAASRRRRVFGLAAALLLVVAAAIGLTAQGLGNDDPQSQARQPSVVQLVKTDPASGAHAAVQLRPTAWGTAMTLTLIGVPGGQRCELIAVSHAGVHEVAASWTVPDGGYNGEHPLVIDGAVGIPLGELTRLDVMTVDGAQLVSMPA